MKNKIIEAYKIYIKGYVKEGKDKMWYGSEDQIAPNFMHDAIRNELQPIASKFGYEVKTKNKGGEYKLKTEIHSKNIDISIIDPTLPIEQQIIIAISFKMPMASVNKNLKNFGETNIGDTALIKEAGIPFYYIAIIDKHPIKLEDGKFTLEKLSKTSLKVFTDLMEKPRSNKYRTDGIFIAVVDFKDVQFKQSVEGQPFSSQSDRRNIGESHLKFIDDVSSENIKINVVDSVGNWIDNFDETWIAFKEMIKLEIQLSVFRKKYL